MGKIVLLRHGKTYANQEKRFFGQSETPLINPPFEGAREMIATDILYSSPLSRCTAYKNSFTFVNYEINDLLKEMHFGSWETKTFAEMENKFPEETAAYITATLEYRFPGGESIDDVLQRAALFYTSISRDLETGKNIAVVSHEGFIKAFLVAVLGINREFFFKFKIDNEHFCVLEYYPGAGKIDCVLTGLNLKELP